MASCGFAQLVGRACGSSAHNPANVRSEFILIRSCKRPMCGRVKLHKGYPRPPGSYRVLGDSDLDCEAKLLLARADKRSTLVIIFCRRLAECID